MPPATSPSSADVADAVNTLTAPVAILLGPIFPLALPGLILVFGPLALLGIALALPLAILAAPLWLMRAALRRRR
jgi:hypothetical protein